MEEELHRKILDELHKIYKAKNSDYGNSFGELYKEFGMLSSIIRIQDKLSRLKSLIKNEQQVKDESIRDTLIDLANYCLLTIMEIDKTSLGESIDDEKV